jgi:hypothetical protein
MISIRKALAQRKIITSIFTPILISICVTFVDDAVLSWNAKCVIYQALVPASSLLITFAVLSAKDDARKRQALARLDQAKKDEELLLLMREEMGGRRARTSGGRVVSQERHLAGRGDSPSEAVLDEKKGAVMSNQSFTYTSSSGNVTQSAESVAGRVTGSDGEVLGSTGLRQRGKGLKNLCQSLPEMPRKTLPAARDCISTSS